MAMIWFLWTKKWIQKRKSNNPFQNKGWQE